MKWCRQCILPDSRPNLVIGDDGVCNACRSHGSKPDIDWAARAASFSEVAADAGRRATTYDCLVPVSGGKDSTWQIVKCLELGLTPLAVTWRPPGRTPIGQRNLDNLISLGVDHIDYSVNPSVEARFMLKAFEEFGSTAIPMHLALFSIPLNLAVRLQIPLVVWGENSAFEYGSADESLTGFKLDAEWLGTFGVTHGTVADDWLERGFTRRELSAYFRPEAQVMDAAGVRAVFLGYYFQWDPEQTARVASAHGFEFHAGGARTGYYDYADIDDTFISLHHWMKWYKFGFTRVFDNLSLEIRNGRMTRDEALAIVADIGDTTPHEDIEAFCRFAGITKQRFMSIAESHRDNTVWQRDADGTPYVPDFPIEGWKWS